jgi:CHAT domain-containing protein
VGNELDALRWAVYPQATVLGPVDDADGPGTPAGLLGRLPGSGAPSPAVVHLACHATAGDDPERSVVDLVEPLSVAAVLRQGARRDRAEPGPVVVLAACETALTRSSHDEALTPATAFLAAGAVGVVGSLWKANNRYTSVLMVVFHHFHHTERLPAPEALRRTQLWALDPARPAVEALLLAGPAALLPPWLRGRLPTLSSVAMWAAFVHHGR